MTVFIWHFNQNVQVDSYSGFTFFSYAFIPSNQSSAFRNILENVLDLFTSLSEKDIIYKLATLFCAGFIYPLIAPLKIFEKQEFSKQQKFC